MKKYQPLLDYYKSCFDLVDCFHFNSETSQSVFLRYLHPQAKKVVPITHSGINDNRMIKEFDKNMLHIGFIGNSTPYKGLPLLMSVLRGIGQYSHWTLSVWGSKIGKEVDLPIYYKGTFNSKTIKQVYKEMDVLIVPSIWKETFSFVTLEALSYGVPVIVSENVGAKDIVKQYNPKFIYSSVDELSNLLQILISDKTLLREFNHDILSKEWNYSMEEHAKEIVNKIYMV